ncbi:MAG: hypothetical protein ABIJ97_13600 [Bacteroidota bacterium]
MKSLFKFIYIITLLSLSVIALYSCKKFKENRSTTSSADNSLAENAFDDVFKVVNETAEDENPNKSTSVYSFGDCAQITINPAWPDTTFPKEIVIDFGTIDCTGNDGRTRRGSIEYTITDRYRNSSSVITVTPNNYFVNDYKIEGLKKITNNGRNSNNNLNYTINVSNGKVTTPEDDIITWQSTRNREWIEGEATTFLTDGNNGIMDDVYSITGNASGVSRNGTDFTVNITEALIAKLNCRWITKGKLEIIPDGLKTRKINYGDGTCDNEATVEIENRTYNIILLQ